MPQHRVRAVAGGAQGIDWPELHEHVVTAVRSYVARSEGKANGRSRPAVALPAGCVAVPVMDLLDEQVDLTPARYVPDAEASDGVQLRDSWLQFEDLLRALSELADLLSRFDLAGEGGTAVTTTVGDLDRAQALTVHRRPGNPCGPDAAWKSRLREQCPC